MIRSLLFPALLVAAVASGQNPALEERLRGESPQALAAAARDLGDAARGALVFHRPASTCATCHRTSEDAAGSSAALGPDLTRLDPPPDDAELVTAILDPSKTVREGFGLTTVLTTTGKSISGLVESRNKRGITLRDPARPESPVHVEAAEIEAVRETATSPMPTGLANQLGDRRAFLDLVRYLIEIRDGGRTRAAELQPTPSQLAVRLPEYEARVDHAGIIASLDDAALERGRAIYNQLCVNCHGTRDTPGSLPTSLRFASGEFQRGGDPFAMYQTLTHGFRMMAPQTWMVPQQKYDVIHYIRETYLRPHNADEYAAVTADYLDRLPPGDTRGPEPRQFTPWSAMDFGRFLINTYEIGDDGKNFAHKGIAVRLDPGHGGVARGRAWVVWDHDTVRLAGAWTGEGFIDWNGIQFNGRHGTHPHVAGDVHFANPTGPGWADPATDSFEDSRRVEGRDGRRYGPLPRDWAQYRGLYPDGDSVILHYTVGDTRVLERPSVRLPEATAANAHREGTERSETERLDGAPTFVRTFDVGPRSRELRLLVATEADEPNLATAVVPPVPGADWVREDRRLTLRLPAGDRPLRFSVAVRRVAKGDEVGARLVDELLRGSTSPKSTPGVADEPRPAFSNEPSVPADLGQVGPPSPARGSTSPKSTPSEVGTRWWPEPVETTALLGDAEGPFAVDELQLPKSNPWLAQVRPTGLDFLPDDPDAMVVCTWDGDVWKITGLAALDGAADGDAVPLRWQRIASGLFQPLGIKLVDGAIYVTCRDQLVVLRDSDGDGETDHYECFNNDHQVTEHFHEFAMGLQTDAEGNFYYAKSARHALKAVVPHHGTLLRVAADGSRTDILATGFRAANGVCLNPDGTFVVTDQEGHWNPKNRINWVRPGEFYGNMFGYHDVTDPSDEAMQPPLCWITNAFDRSPGELLWVPECAPGGAARPWQPLSGQLLNLSYGYGKLFVVPFEEVDGQKQGGMCALPIDSLPTGVMRGRFDPASGHLFACGMFAWAGSATEPGGLYRIRATGRPMHLPVGLETAPEQFRITFTDPLDPQTAADPANYTVRIWSLRRTANYGSEHHDERELKVTAARLADDGRTVTLELPDLQPTWGMAVTCRLQTPDGTPIERTLHNTIHRIGSATP